VNFRTIFLLLGKSQRKEHPDWPREQSLSQLCCLFCAQSVCAALETARDCENRRVIWATVLSSDRIAVGREVIVLPTWLSTTKWTVLFIWLITALTRDVCFTTKILGLKLSLKVLLRLHFWSIPFCYLGLSQKVSWRQRLLQSSRYVQSSCWLYYHTTASSAAGYQICNWWCFKAMLRATCYSATCCLLLTTLVLCHLRHVPCDTCVMLLAT